MKFSIFLISLAIFATFGFQHLHAQPNKFGCHHFRNLNGKMNRLTEQQRSEMNESIARSDTFDVVHYNIHIDVTDYAGATIKAATTISYSPKIADQQFIRFDLFELVVDSVKNDSGALTFEYDNEILKVNFVAVPEVGEIFDLTVYYHGEPHHDFVWGGFYFESNYIYNLGIGLTSIPPNFGKVWYPCFDSFVERATYEYHVKSAGTFRAYCQGDFLGEEVLGGDTVIRSFALNQPIPTHISAIAVADYQSYEYTHDGLYGEVPITLTAKPNNLTAMQGKFTSLGNAIDACEYWYGPHAFNRVGYVLTTDGALEIPTNIAYPAFMTGESTSANEGLYSHELGHHWWGDMVTPLNHNDMWLKEGPAEYSSHLFVENKYGTEDFVETVKENQLFVLEEAHINDDGFQPMSPMPDEHIYGTHTYYKGASVVHNLRGYLGDELFRQAMSGVQENLAATDITPEQFRDALEVESGIELNSFFEDQIFAPGFATFVVDSFSATPTGNSWNVDVHIQQKLREAPHFHTDVPMDLTIMSTDWQRQDFVITAGDEFTDITLSTDFEPVLIFLNGYNRLNQNRMDHEVIVYPTGSLLATQPFVEFKLYDDQIVDSTLVRMEHIWSGPDDENLGEGIFDISNTHYWIVDGIWPDGTGLSGKLTYAGYDEFDFDYDLYNDTEADVVLLYRPIGGSTWNVYPYFTVNAGSLNNGAGTIEIDVLLKGQYAFGNGDPSVHVQIEPIINTSIKIFPVPTNETLYLSGNYPRHETALFEISDINGKLLIRSTSLLNGEFKKDIDVSWLENGVYILTVRTVAGEVICSERFEKIKL